MGSYNKVSFPPTIARRYYMAGKRREVTGSVIKQLLSELGWTAYDLGKYLNVQEHTIWYWLNQRTPQWKFVHELDKLARNRLNRPLIIGLPTPDEVANR